MSNGTTNRITFSNAAQTALRMLIASYFLAVALGIIPGTDLGLLLAPILPPTVAAAVAAAAVFLLSFMVMTAIHTRVAALILGLMTFYASYLAMVELGVGRELGAFWRDLALIAALLLTYSDNSAGLRGRRSPIHRHVSPRRITMVAQGDMTRQAQTIAAPHMAAPNAARHPSGLSPRAERSGLAHDPHRTVEPDIINIFSDEDRFA